MDRALVVIDGTESTKQLVREAGELATGVGAELILLYVTTEEEFAEEEETLASIADFDSTYGVSQAVEGSEQFASNVGNEVFDGMDVEFEAMGRIGDEIEEALEVAEEYDVDHVFVRGRQRSPTGKALFGDRAQQIALDFDGPVTLVTTDEE